jgi:hypothetical protein
LLDSGRVTEGFMDRVHQNVGGVDRPRVDSILFHADDCDAPIGYRLVPGLLFIVGCYVCAVALAVLGGIGWINGWPWSARALIVAAGLVASIGALTNASGLPWLWD